MSLFDRLVDEALRNRADLALLRPVVEKELLHHDILREMSEAKLLTPLTFIGGTCLRACYGSDRLSEDLDFTGGAEFTRESLSNLADVLVSRLETRYDLPVKVSEPKKTGGNVSTWKMKVETRPEQAHLPAQRIHIDICAIPSLDPQPMMLRNIYQVDLGTSGLILQAQSREEILADKIVAFALRERIKNRDLWDIAWLVQQGIVFRPEWISEKMSVRNKDPKTFAALSEARVENMRGDPQLRDDFIQEMRRFLPAKAVTETVENPDYWKVLTQVIHEQCRLAAR